MHYDLIRSARRTLSIRVLSTGVLEVRAPHFLARSVIEDFIERKQIWIERQKRKRIESSQPKLYSEAEYISMKAQCEHYIIPRVSTYWEGRGLPRYKSIKITKSDHRWGSCSGTNSLCFSYRLADYIQNDPDIIDAIIFHELAHLREKHHQKSFYKLLYTLYPQYEQVVKRLKSRGI